MATYKAKNINQEFSLADGDILELIFNYPVRLVISAVSSDVTVSTQVITDGSFRDISPVVTSTGALISSDVLPPRAVYKFTGGASEVKVYGA